MKKTGRDQASKVVIEVDDDLAEEIEEMSDGDCSCGCGGNCGGEGDGSQRKSTYASETVYGLGVIGAAVFYIGQAATFWLGVLGFLKALVWPAFLVYEVLKFLGN